VTAICDLGQVDGVVETQDGNLVSGAVVWLARETRPDQPFRQTVTDQTGHFEIRNVSPGEYRAEAFTRVDAFRTVRRTGSTPALTFPVTLAPYGHTTVTLKLSTPGQPK
jgi:hypothetical protein